MWVVNHCFSKQFSRNPLRNHFHRAIRNIFDFKDMDEQLEIPMFQVSQAVTGRDC